MRITNRITNGRRVTVFGYGSVGRGVAMYFRNLYSVVSVVEPQPVLQLRAVLDGIEVPDRAEAVRTADVIVTVTGAPNIVTAADLPLFKDGVIMMNSGHLPWEIDVDGLLGDPSVASIDEVVDGITILHLSDGRAIHILTHGHMVNLAGTAAARQLDRIDGPGLHAPGAMPGGRGERDRSGDVVRRTGPGRHRRPGRLRLREPRPTDLALRSTLAARARPAPQYWNSSSRYFGSGQRSSATSVSSASTTSRSAAWAGMTEVANAFASACTEPASWAWCWARSSAAIASTSESARSETRWPIVAIPRDVDAPASPPR